MKYDARNILFFASNLCHVNVFKLYVDVVWFMEIPWRILQPVLKNASSFGSQNALNLIRTNLGFAQLYLQIHLENIRTEFNLFEKFLVLFRFSFEFLSKLMYCLRRHTILKLIMFWFWPCSNARLARKSLCSNSVAMKHNLCHPRWHTHVELNIYSGLYINYKVILIEIKYLAVYEKFASSGMRLQSYMYDMNECGTEYGAAAKNI